MVHWPFLAFDRWVTGNPRRLARAGGYAPWWLVRRIAEAKLVRTLRHVWDHCRRQRERWRDAGVRRGDLRSASVLPHLPFSDPRDIALHPEAYFCVPEDQLVGMILTSGTTGTAKRIYFTRDDLDLQARMIAAYLRRLPGASRVLIVFNLATQPSASPALIAHRGAETAGMFSILVPSCTLFPAALQHLRDYRLDTVIAAPTRMHQLTLEAGVDLRSFGVKYFLLSSEPWSEKLRRLIEDAWGAKALDVYASNETACGIASECVHQNGLHVGEIHHWIEIVDPATGTPLPDGSEGEIVITTLSRRGMPLVRYRIGDLARLEPPGERCACGMTLRKLSRIRGRVDNMIILGGGCNVYPDEFDNAILGIDGVTDYQIVLERDRYREVLHLDVECDLPDETLRSTVTRALLTVHGVQRKVEATRDLDFGRIRAVPHGSLSAGRNKTQRVVDRRDAGG